MATHGYRNRQSADRTEVPLRPLASLAVQLLVLEFCCTLLAYLPVLLAVGLLSVHAAVLDEAAGRAVLQLDGASLAVTALATAGAHVSGAAVDRDAAHVGKRRKRSSTR